MDRYDREDFDMFQKRNKDDEDLDNLSKNKLLSFFEKYVPERIRR